MLNVLVMQMDKTADSGEIEKERERERKGARGGVIACPCGEESNLRAIKKCGRPTALRFAF